RRPPRTCPFRPRAHPPGDASRPDRACRRCTRRTGRSPHEHYPCLMAGALEPKLKTLPAKPGVYLFRDAKGRVLYIGKAKSLRPRVRSYFQAARGRTTIRGLPEKVADIEVIVTGTEVEALHLEQNLIRRHRPPFN